MKDFRKQPTFIFLGRTGSGKTTHGSFLAKKLGLKKIVSGDLLRRLAKKPDYWGRKLKEAMTKGKLAPTFLVFPLWAQRLKKFSRFPGIMIDGSPRRLVEAELLDEALEWYERKNVLVILCEVSRELAFKRLVRRGRGQDDSPKAIDERLDLFEKEVVPVIKHYEEKGILIRFDTSGQIDEVNEKLLKLVLNLNLDDYAKKFRRN